MEIKLPHNLPEEAALGKIKNLLNKVQAQSGNTISNLKQSWNGSEGNYSFTAKGFNVSGNIKVQPSLVVLNLKLPLAAMLFKGKIKSIIEQEGTKVLS